MTLRATAVMTIGSTNVAGGASFAGPLLVDCCTNALGRYQVQINYDTNVVRLTGMAGGTVPFNTLLANTNTPGKIIMTGENAVCLNTPTGVVSVAQLSFLAVGGMNSSTSLLLNDTSILNTEAASMISSNGDGIVTVDLDANGDLAPSRW